VLFEPILGRLHLTTPEQAQRRRAGARGLFLYRVEEGCPALVAEPPNSLAQPIVLLSPPTDGSPPLSLRSPCPASSYSVFTRVAFLGPFPTHFCGRLPVLLLFWFSSLGSLARRRFPEVFFCRSSRSEDFPPLNHLVFFLCRFRKVVAFERLTGRAPPSPPPPPMSYVVWFFEMV